jgi:hypothetical protein
VFLDFELEALYQPPPARRLAFDKIFKNAKLNLATVNKMYVFLSFSPSA